MLFRCVVHLQNWMCPTLLHLWQLCELCYWGQLSSTKFRVWQPVRVHERIIFGFYIQNCYNHVLDARVLLKQDFDKLHYPTPHTCTHECMHSYMQAHTHSCTHTYTHARLFHTHRYKLTMQSYITYNVVQWIRTVWVVLHWLCVAQLFSSIATRNHYDNKDPHDNQIPLATRVDASTCYNHLLVCGAYKEELYSCLCFSGSCCVWPLSPW